MYIYTYIYIYMYMYIYIQKNLCPATHKFVDIALFMQKTGEILISVI